MEVTKNIIEEGSSGIQSGRDTNISNNYSNGLIEQFIKDNVLPVLKKDVYEIKDSFGKQIRDVLDSGLIAPLKRELEKENLEYHINNVRGSLKNISNTEFDPHVDIEEPVSQEKSTKRMDLIGEWVENVDKISSNEELLSEIWEGWFVKLSTGGNQSDLEIYLKKMKELNAEEGDLLLRFQRRYRPFPFPIPFGIKLTNKEKYILRRLKSNELIEIDSFNIVFSLIFFVVFPIVVLLILKDSYLFSKSIDLEFMPIYYVVLAIPISFLFFFFTRGLSVYKLTWIGRGIISFAKSNKIKYYDNKKHSDIN